MMRRHHSHTALAVTALLLGALLLATLMWMTLQAWVIIPMRLLAGGR